MQIKQANLSRFSLNSVLRKRDLVNEEISSKHTTPFPKDEKRFLSHYRYRKRYIEITPQGEVVGGLSHMFVSLIDLSFFRSVVAEHYGKRGYHCYDPCSFICLDICGALDGRKDTASLCKKLRDPDEGILYRSYAGIDPDHIPSEDDPANFRKRVGEDSYNQVLHALVDVAYLLGFLAGGLIASTDGYLVPTYSRFRGCDHFSEDCLRLHIENLLPSKV